MSAYSITAVRYFNFGCPQKQYSVSAKTIFGVRKNNFECPFFPILYRLWHPAGVVIGRGVKIGNNVSIFSNVTIGGLGHSIFHHGEPGYPEIGDNVILYTNVTVLGPVKIGNNTTIGAHSLILESFPDNCLVAGSPAKVIKSF